MEDSQSVSEMLSEPAGTRKKSQAGLHRQRKKLSQPRPRVPTGAKLSLADKSRVHIAQTYVPMRSPGTTLTVDPGRPRTSFLPSCSSHSAPTTPPLTTPLHPHASHVLSAPSLLLPLPSHCSDAAQAWLKGCLLPLGGIPSPPHPYQESKLEFSLPFFLALIPMPSRLSHRGDIQESRTCVWSTPPAAQRRFVRGYGRTDLHKSLWYVSHRTRMSSVVPRSGAGRQGKQQAPASIPCVNPEVLLGSAASAGPQLQCPVALASFCCLVSSPPGSPLSHPCKLPFFS